MPRYYTREDLKWLLQSDEISDEFRRRIEAALKDGSQAALESLGTAHSTQLPARKVPQ